MTYFAPHFWNSSAQLSGSNLAAVNRGMKSLYPNVSSGPKCCSCHAASGAYMCFSYHSLPCAGTSYRPQCSISPNLAAAYQSGTR